MSSIEITGNDLRTSSGLRTWYGILFLSHQTLQRSWKLSHSVRMIRSPVTWKRLSRSSRPHSSSNCDPLLHRFARPEHPDLTQLAGAIAVRRTHAARLVARRRPRVARAICVDDRDLRAHLAQVERRPAAPRACTDDDDVRRLARSHERHPRCRRDLRLSQPRFAPPTRNAPALAPATFRKSRRATEL